MYLKNISLINFKNYAQVELQFSPKINCFVGNNGVGKTNILDAIHYLSITKSFFNSIDTQNIRYEEDFFIIQGDFEKEGKTESIYCGIRKNRKKQFKRNKKEYQRLADHIGLLPVVMISPADSSLISEGSEERRKFIDAVISQYDKPYLEDLINYNRALSQRNILLKEFAKTDRFDNESLQLWDDQLIPHGERIHSKRVNFIKRLIPIFQKYYDSIAMGGEKVNMIYQSHLKDSQFRTLLNESRYKDRILQYTTVGIHKDDLNLQLSGYPIKRVGSQGQQKTYLVALKLAKLEFIRNIAGFHPILLLDDIFDKFDKLRVTQIIELVAHREFGQIFITDTNQDRLENILADMPADYKLFKINEDIREVI
ncbi:MAG: DNA replication/repair protein RecF [Bacteroidales bacterium]|nr:MAG: DNA replication/repair protein RecF [Bacteroidales bacterium]